MAREWVSTLNMLAFTAKHSHDSRVSDIMTLLASTGQHVLSIYINKSITIIMNHLHWLRPVRRIVRGSNDGEILIPRQPCWTGGWVRWQHVRKHRRCDDVVWLGVSRLDLKAVVGLIGASLGAFGSLLLLGPCDVVQFSLVV